MSNCYNGKQQQQQPNETMDIQYMSMKFCEIDVVVNHVTNVAIEHGLLKKSGKRLRFTHCRDEFPYLKLCRPAYFFRTYQLLPHPGHEYTFKIVSHYFKIYKISGSYSRINIIVFILKIAKSKISTYLAGRSTIFLPLPLDSVCKCKKCYVLKSNKT